MTDMPHIAAGRFVIHLGDQTIQGVSAEEAIEIIDNEGDDATELFVIHRVMPDGRMELAGLERSALLVRDCLLFSRNDVAGARRDYDAIVEHAKASPPPCRIELQFGHAKSLSLPHVVVMIFPQACQTGVGGWVNAMAFHPGETAEGSPSALRDLESAAPQIVLSTTLEPV